VVVIPAADPDPIARTWLAHLEPALSPVPGVPPLLMAMLPPAVDGAELQADAFAMVGLRGEGGLRRHIPSLDGADTLASSPEPTLIWLPPASTSAWPIPIVDPRDRIAGVLLAVGGLRRGTRWFPAADGAAQWGAMLDRLVRAGPDRDASRETPQAAGRVRLIPLSTGELVAVQAFYSWPSEGPPVLSRVAVSLGDSARAASSLAAAVGAPVTSGPEPASPEAQQERMRALYAEMRAALQRNDWVAFGAAFDALGALLGRR
jgi:hypothetical protein